VLKNPVKKSEILAKNPFIQILVKNKKFKISPETPNFHQIIIA